jgi:micrococcal nuclease
VNKLRLPKIKKSTPVWLALLILLISFVYEAELQNNVVQEPAPQPGYFRVTRVVDGDTIIVNAEGEAERVRLIGVDTPEINDPRKPVQCYAQAASDFTKDMLHNSVVRLEADALSADRDRYNRLLRYVYLDDGRLLNLEIIRQGYGFAYTSFPFTKSQAFISAQRDARQQNVGLWNECGPENPQ